MGSSHLIEILLLIDVSVVLVFEINLVVGYDLIVGETHLCIDKVLIAVHKEIRKVQ